jgi:hypothetical protein
MGYHEMVPVPSITYIYVLGYVHSENDHVRTRSKIPGVGQIEACMHGGHPCMHTRTKLGACVQEVHAQARSGPTIPPIAHGALHQYDAYPDTGNTTGNYMTWKTCLSYTNTCLAKWQA